MGVCVMSFPQSHLSPFYILDLETNIHISFVSILYFRFRKIKRNNTILSRFGFQIWRQIFRAHLSPFIFQIQRQISTKTLSQLGVGGTPCPIILSFFFNSILENTYHTHKSEKKRHCVWKAKAGNKTEENPPPPPVGSSLIQFFVSFLIQFLF